MDWFKPSIQSPHDTHRSTRETAPGYAAPALAADSAGSQMLANCATARMSPTSPSLSLTHSVALRRCAWALPAQLADARELYVRKPMAPIPRYVRTRAQPLRGRSCTRTVARVPAAAPSPARTVVPHHRRPSALCALTLTLLLLLTLAYHRRADALSTAHRWLLVL